MKPKINEMGNILNLANSIKEFTGQDVKVKQLDDMLRLSWLQPNYSENNVDFFRYQMLKLAILNKLDNYFVSFKKINNIQYMFIKYNQDYNKQDINPNACKAKRYCRKLQEVYAIQVQKNNENELNQFTGGGFFKTLEDNSIEYIFADSTGFVKSAKETDYIVFINEITYKVLIQSDFEKEYEPK